MNTLIALTMAGIFSYWIWLLKRQIESLQQTAAGKNEPLSFQKSQESSEEHLMRRNARDIEGGIPTWTL